jgi:hypothetical protein
MDIMDINQCCSWDRPTLGTGPLLGQAGQAPPRIAATILVPHPHNTWRIAFWVC